MRDIPLEYKLELRQILRLKFEQYLIWYMEYLQFTDNAPVRARYMKAGADVAQVFGTFFGDHVQKHLEPQFQSLFMIPTEKNNTNTTLSVLVHAIHMLHPGIFPKEDVHQAFSGFVELAEKLAQIHHNKEHGPSLETIERFDRIQTYTARVADFLALRMIRVCAVSSKARR